MCKYCDKDLKTLCNNIEDGEGIRVLLNSKRKMLTIEAKFDSGYIGDWIDLVINYCPVCGKKL